MIFLCNYYVKNIQITDSGVRKVHSSDHENDDYCHLHCLLFGYSLASDQNNPGMDRIKPLVINSAVYQVSGGVSSIFFP